MCGLLSLVFNTYYGPKFGYFTQRVREAGNLLPWPRTWLSGTVNECSAVRLFSGP
jgi:hypothetical protein